MNRTKLTVKDLHAAAGRFASCDTLKSEQPNCVINTNHKTNVKKT